MQTEDDSVGSAQLLDRMEYALKCQVEEINRLRAELERRDAELTHLLAWVNEDCDALTILQRIYLDHNATTPDRIKAAGAAIAYERPKLTLSMQIGPALLGQRLDRARMKTVEPKVIEHQSS
jgi:hypothetical protein